METGRTVFAQLVDFLPRYDFQQCVKRYRGNYKIKTFSCWDQFLSMAFAQLTYRESLRDIEACLRSVRHKLYHTGFRGKVSRNTLAHANEIRDWPKLPDEESPVPPSMRNYKFVLVEVEEGNGCLKPGYYLSPLTPKKGWEKL